MTTVYTLVPNWRTGNWAASGVILRPDGLAEGSKVGEGVPFYRSKIKRGISASSPYSVDICRVERNDPLNFVHDVWIWSGNEPVPRFAYETNGFYFALGSGPVSGIIPHQASVSTEKDNKAISRLHSKIRDDSYSVNGPLVLGELRETIGMLRSPFRSMREATITYMKALNLRASHVRKVVTPRRSDTAAKLSYRRAQALKDGMAGTWLEFQFGIKPLISDTKEIIEALDRTVDTFTERQKRFSGSAKEQPVKNSTSSGSDGSMYTCDSYMVTQTLRTEASVRYVAIYRRTFDGSTKFLGRLRQNLGFTVENFVPTVWELVPWSFLIDYFVNVGSILECSTTSGLSLVTCVRTERLATRLTFLEFISGYSESPALPFSGSVVTHSLIGKVRSERQLLRTTLERTVRTELPVPSLVFSVPGWGSVKWANMAALLSSSQDLSRFRRG